MNIDSLKVGIVIDTQDKFGKWCESTVISINHVIEHIHVQYHGWYSYQHEWISFNDSDRFAPRSTHTININNIIKLGYQGFPTSTTSETSTEFPTNKELILYVKSLEQKIKEMKSELEKLCYTKNNKNNNEEHEEGYAGPGLIN